MRKRGVVAQFIGALLRLVMVGSMFGLIGRVVLLHMLKAVGSLFITLFRVRATMVRGIRGRLSLLRMVTLPLVRGLLLLELRVITHLRVLSVVMFVQEHRSV